MAQKDREHIRRLREEANAIRLRQEAERRRSRTMKAIAIIAGSAVVIAAIVWLAVFGPSVFGPKAPEFTTDGTISVTGSDGTEHEVPIKSADAGSSIVVGNPEAPVTIDYWFDFSCPHCIDYHHATAQTFHDLVASGQAQVKYHPIHIVAPYGRQAGAALLAATQHQPGTFFSVYDGLYLIPATDQGSWGPADYADIMGEFGVTDQAALDEIRAGTYLPTIDAHTTQATTKDGVKGTPTVAVNGQLQDGLPDSAGLIALVGEHGGDVTQLPTAAPTPAV